MKSKLTIFALCMINFISCAEKEHEVIRYLENHNLTQNFNHGLYIFMPTQGCTNCLLTLTKEISKIEIGDNTSFILFANNKTTLNSFRKKLPETDNVILDYSMNLNDELTSFVYPVIYLVNNKEVVEKIIVTTTNIKTAIEFIKDNSI